MADFTTANLITATNPGRFAQGIATNSPITITFLRPIDQTTLTDATIALEIVGTVARIPVAYSYSVSTRTLTITPSGGLAPNTSYKLTLVGDVTPVQDILTTHVTGIKDIAGNGFIGEFTLIFTTGALSTPGTPILISPISQTAVTTQPQFSWTAVTGATQYQIQVSTSNTFEILYWPLLTDAYNMTATTVTPSRPFGTNQEYWWRVRAVIFNTQGQAIPGNWSPSTNFYYGDPTYGSVTPDDEPLGLVPPLVNPVEVISATPAPQTANLQPSQYPAAITVVLNGSVDLSQIDNSTLTIEGVPVDGIFLGGTFTPIFSPSLNGSIYGSGGITMPAPVDAYQQIIPSGKLNSSVPATGNTDAYTSTISLPVDSGYFQDNNIYNITLSLNELSTPLTWSFSSRYFPVFCSSFSVRQVTDHFMPDIREDEIWWIIRLNSLNAIWLQTYPPTQIDAWSWIYNPPISFDPNNPLYFVREYVRLKTSLDLLQHKLGRLINNFGSVQLGDFRVDSESAAVKVTLEAAIEQIEKELKPFRDKLHGHTNRGWARGEWAQRSERSHVNTVWGYPNGYRGRRF